MTPPGRDPDIVRFAKLVRSMRAAQSRYFKGGKSTADLEDSKALERQVDRAVAWVLDDRQAELFPAEAKGADPCNPT